MTDISQSPCFRTLNSTLLVDLVRLNIDRARATVPFQVYCIFFGIIGAFGNLFVIYTFIRKQTKTSATYFILTLAGIDLNVCLTVIPFTVVHEAFNKYAWVEVYSCKIFEWFKHSSLSVSCLTLAFIAIDRYIAICHPLSVLVNQGRVKVVITLSFVIGTIFQIQTLVFFGIRTTRVADNLIGCRCDVKDQYYRTAYHVWFISSLLFCYVLLFVIIVVCYFNVWMTVRRRHIERQKEQLRLGLSSIIARMPPTQTKCGTFKCVCCWNRKGNGQVKPQNEDNVIPVQNNEQVSPSVVEENRVDNLKANLHRNNNTKREYPPDHQEAGTFNKTHMVENSVYTRPGSSHVRVAWYDIHEEDILSNDEGAVRYSKQLQPKERQANYASFTPHGRSSVVSNEKTFGDDNISCCSSTERRHRNPNLVVPSIYAVNPPNATPPLNDDIAKRQYITNNSIELNACEQISLGNVSKDSSDSLSIMTSDSGDPRLAHKRHTFQFLNRLESVRSVDFRDQFVPQVEKLNLNDEQSQITNIPIVIQEHDSGESKKWCSCRCRNSCEEVTKEADDKLSKDITSSLVCCTSSFVCSTSSLWCCTMRSKPCREPRKLRMSVSMQATLNSFQQARYKTARLLLIVTIVFLLTWFPFWVVLILTYQDRQLWFKAGPVKLNLLLIFRHFYFTNSMANPFIYAFLNQGFRNDLQSCWQGVVKKCKKA